MRRAAALAIAVVLALLLLLRPAKEERAARSHPAWREPPGESAREAPEPAAPAPEAAAAPAEPGAIAEGVVTDADGQPLAGLRLLAIPRDEVEMWDAEDPFTPRGKAPDVPFAHTDASGAFAFRDLPAGDYRLGIDEDWMLDQRLTFRADTKGIRAVAARAWTATVIALDLATSEPIPRFLVRYGSRTGSGIDGVFRVRLHGSSGRGTHVGCRVEAEGYHPAAASVTVDPSSMKVWLARIVEPRLSVRARFDDGAPCEEEAAVFVQHRAEYRGTTIPVKSSGGGLYHVPLPPGRWFVDFRPAHSDAFRTSWTAEVELEAGESREIFLELERGGELVVRRPGWAGTAWLLAVTQFRGDVMLGNASFTVEGAEHILRHVEPGRYVLRLIEGEAPGWSRTVEVTVGSRHELTIE